MSFVKFCICIQCQGSIEPTILPLSPKSYGREGEDTDYTYNDGRRFKHCYGKNLKILIKYFDILQYMDSSFIYCVYK